MWNTRFSLGVTSLLASGSLLAACSGGASSLPVVQTNTQQSGHAIHTQSAGVPSTDCSTPPIKGIRATVSSPLSITSRTPVTFTVCTQYFSVYTISASFSPSGAIAPLPASVTPTVPADSPIYSASVTITPQASGSGTITITDKKKHSVQISVTVTLSQTFPFTGSAQHFTVPSGVTSITADVVGPGSSVDTFPGQMQCSLGEELVATLPVTPNETLNIYVGGASDPSGAGGFNGGGTDAAGGAGGGGASDIREGGTALSNRIIVVGGGGGCGRNNPNNVFVWSSGGDGGFPNGSAGQDVSGNAGSGGGGGAQTLINNAGSGTDNGSAGTLGVGADSNPDFFEGGAGGGGYYGGGSGAHITGDLGGGGGGGSSFVENSIAPTLAQVATSGRCDSKNNGCIMISW